MSRFPIRSAWLVLLAACAHPARVRPPEAVGRGSAAAESAYAATRDARDRIDVALAAGRRSLPTARRSSGRPDATTPCGRRSATA